MKTPVLPLLIIALLATPSTDSRAANGGYLMKNTPAAPQPAAVQETVEAPAPEQQQAEPPVVVPMAVIQAAVQAAGSPDEYTVGIDDVLEIRVLKPEEILTLATVTPDGSINFPYIGNVNLKGRTIVQVQEEIQNRLANGYMRYPIVSVSLKESRSRKFFVYGEVLKPGPYPIEENMSVLRAISMSGGFTRFGSSSRVKVLRPKKTGPGYETIKVNIKAVMEGNSDEDVLLKQGDIVTVSEGVF